MTVYERFIVFFSPLECGYIISHDGHFLNRMPGFFVVPSPGGVIAPPGCSYWDGLLPAPDLADRNFGLVHGGGVSFGPPLLILDRLCFLHVILALALSLVRGKESAQHDKQSYK